MCTRLHVQPYGKAKEIIDSLIVSGNEATVTAWFTELLSAGLDELYVGLLPITYHEKSYTWSVVAIAITEKNTIGRIISR
jgi:hypothetical protein